MTICRMNLLFQGAIFRFYVKLWKRNPRGLTHKMPRWIGIQLLHLHLIGIQSQLPTAVELLHGRLHRLRCFKTSIALDSFSLARQLTIDPVDVGHKKRFSKMHFPSFPAFRASSKVTEVFSVLFTIAFFTLGKQYWITTDIALSSFQPKPIRTYLSKQSFQSFLKQFPSGAGSLVPVEIRSLLPVYFQWKFRV